MKAARIYLNVIFRKCCGTNIKYQTNVLIFYILEIYSKGGRYAASSI